MEEKEINELVISECCGTCENAGRTPMDFVVHCNILNKPVLFWNLCIPNNYKLRDGINQEAIKSFENIVNASIDKLKDKGLL